MSTIAVDDVRPSLGGTATDILEGLSKASATYDQVSVAVDDSYNVSSISDVSTGIYAPSLTNNFAAATYRISGLCGSAGASIERTWQSIEYDTPPTTSAYEIACVEATNTLADQSYACTSCIGDLA